MTEVDLKDEAGIGVDPALEAFLCHFLTFVSAFLHAPAVYLIKNSWPCTFTMLLILPARTQGKIICLEPVKFHKLGRPLILVGDSDDKHS